MNHLCPTHSRHSQAHTPVSLTLSKYAHNPTQPPSPSKYRARLRRRSNMPARGSTGGGRASVSGLGKRRRNAVSEPAESDDEPRASGRGRGRGRGSRQPRGKGRGRGRAKVDDIRHRSVRAVRHESTTTTTTTTATSTKSRPYNRAFSQHLLNNNILPLLYESADGADPEPPDNMREILDELGAVRTSEPTEDFRRFQRHYRRASNEDDAVNQLSGYPSGR